MAVNSIMERLLDPYDRKARLWPALLALLPALVLVSSMYVPLASLAANAVTLAASSGALYLLSNVAREYGKRLENQLFQSWGGKPTTQILRHGDMHFDAVTKARFHSFLAAKLGVHFPAAQAEAADPAKADDVYQSAGVWLLSQTRDTTKFALLFRENIAYGFRRNALGLKPLGIVAAAGSMIWVLVAEGVILFLGNMPWWNSSKFAMLSFAASLTLATSGVLLAAWLFFFTRATVRTAAFAYADTLVKTCDQL